MKFIAYLLSYFLYFLGDVTCKIMDFCYDKLNCGFGLYHVYNRLMITSMIVQRKFDAKGPWEEPNE